MSWPSVLVLLALADPTLSSSSQPGWLHTLPPTLAPSIKETIASPSLVVPPLRETFPGRLETYEALLYRPDWVARLWQAVGYRGTTVRKLEDGWFEATDQRGNLGRWCFVYRGATLAVAFGEGVYRTPLSRRSIPFRVVVEWRYADRIDNGTSYITHSCRAFFRLTRPEQHGLLSIVRPVAQPLAERRLKEAMLSLSIPVRLELTNPGRFGAWVRAAGLTELAVEGSPAHPAALRLESP